MVSNVTKNKYYHKNGLLLENSLTEIKFKKKFEKILRAFEWFCKSFRYIADSSISGTKFVCLLNPPFRARYFQIWFSSR